MVYTLLHHPPIKVTILHFPEIIFANAGALAPAEAGALAPADGRVTPPVTAVYQRVKVTAVHQRVKVTAVHQRVKVTAVHQRVKVRAVHQCVKVRAVHQIVQVTAVLLGPVRIPDAKPTTRCHRWLPHGSGPSHPACPGTHTHTGTP